MTIPEDKFHGNGSPTVVRWYPNGRLLAVAFTSGVIVFHHHERLEVIGHFNAAESGRGSEAEKSPSVLCFDVTSGSRFLAAGTNTGQLNIWDMKTGNIVNNFDVGATVGAVAFQQTVDARYVACATGSDVLLYSRASNRLVDTFTVAPTDSDTPGATTTQPKVTSLAFSPHAVSLLAVCDDAGNLNVWDISRTHASRGSSTDSKIDTESTYSRFPSSLGTAATCLSFASTTASIGLLVANLDKQIRVYDKLLKRLLFSISCAAPVTSVAYCWDDTHIAAGHSNGETSIMRISVAEKDAVVVATLPCPEMSADTPHSIAVRSLQFQPKVSAGSDLKTNPLTERLAKRSHSSSNITDSTPFRAAIRANTSPSPSVMTGMLLKTPERAKDDSFPQRRPRDSDIFSPVVRLPRHEYADEAKSMAENTPVGEYTDDLLIPEFNTARNGYSHETNGMPSVVDRRMSDIIPTASSVPVERSEYSRFEYNENDEILDSDAVDELLSPTVPEAGADREDDEVDDDDYLVGATKVSDEPMGNGDSFARETPQMEKKTSLPRGVAFSKMRKSASEIGQRNLALPPRPPRSSTLPKSAKKPEIRETADETTENDDVPEKRANNSFTTPRREVGRGLPLTTNLTIPSLDRKNSSATSGVDVSALADVVRQTIIAEMDPVRQDIRADVLNFHTELVLSFSRQTREIEQMFIRQKKEIDELKQEVASLRKENAEMREMYME